LITPPKGGLIFGNGFIFTLAFVMFEHCFYPSLVPTFWKSISCSHFRFFFIRRLNATSGLPVT
jgi:hypothetical protein